METTRAPATKRRWFQYSLRTLLLLVLLVSVGMSWFAVKLERARRQRAAANAIVASHGRVYYGFELDAAGKPVKGNLPFAPAWLRKYFGDDLFNDVTAIEILTDEQLEQAKDFHELQALRFYCSARITDESLAHLEHMPRLRSLRFGANGNVTDVGLEHLQALHRLESLDIKYLRHSSRTLKRLETLPSLKELSVGWGVTDADVDQLCRMTSLDTLDLRLASRLSSASLARLQAALPDCQIKRR